MILTLIKTYLNRTAVLFDDQIQHPKYHSSDKSRLDGNIIL